MIIPTTIRINEPTANDIRPYMIAGDSHYRLVHLAEPMDGAEGSDNYWVERVAFECKSAVYDSLNDLTVRWELIRYLSDDDWELFLLGASETEVENDH